MVYSNLSGFIVVFVFTASVYLINKHKGKYKMGMRRWIGAILTLLGVMSLFGGSMDTNTPYPFVTILLTFIILLIFIVGGLCLWFIRPEPVKQKMKK